MIRFCAQDNPSLLLGALFQENQKAISLLHEENYLLEQKNAAIAGHCTVLESAIGHLSTSSVGSNMSSLVSNSKQELLQKNETAMEKLRCLESEKQNHLFALQNLKADSVVPQYAETLRQEIDLLERQHACYELDICDLTMRIDAMRIVSLPISQQLEQSRLKRAELNAQANCLSREISEAEDLEQNLRNEVRLPPAEAACRLQGQASGR
jgi:hypothetical protein